MPLSVSPRFGTAKSRGGGVPVSVPQDEQIESQWRSDACQRCQGDVGFESVVCVSCGCSVSYPPSPDECSLRPFRDGYLIDLHHYGSHGDHRLECEHGARKAFDVDRSSYCDYCEHMMGKD